MGGVLGITRSRDLCQLEEDVKKADTREFLMWIQYKVTNSYLFITRKIIFCYAIILVLSYLKTLRILTAGC